MANYTQGPWKRVNTSYINEGETMVEHWVLGSNGEELACCDNPHDAALIHAAPDLFEALIELRKQVIDLLIPALNLIPKGVGGIEFPDHVAWGSCVAKVDSAIEKAEQLRLID